MGLDRPVKAEQMYQNNPHHTGSHPGKGTLPQSGQVGPQGHDNASL